MPIFDMAAFEAGTRIKYAEKMERMWREEASPFCQWVKRTQNFTGKFRTINPLVSHGSGATTAQGAIARKRGHTSVQFEVTRVKEFAFLSLDNETLMASEGVGAIESALDTNMASLKATFSAATSHQIWRNGGGARGEIAVGGISGDTATLTNLADLAHFWEQMPVELSDDDGTGGAGVRLGTPLVVEAVDPDALTVTFTADIVASIPGAVEGDFLFRQDDYNNVLSGVMAWIPPTAPSSSDDFFSVNRSVMVHRLAGHRITASGSNIEDALIDGITRGSIFGGKFDTIWMGSERYGELLKSMSSKAWIDIKADVANLSFKGLAIPTSRGTVAVMDDWALPNRYSLATKRDCWELSSLGSAPHFDEQGGGRLFVEAGADAKEIRTKAYWNLLCHRPVDNVLFDWGT